MRYARICWKIPNLNNLDINRSKPFNIKLPRLLSLWFFPFQPSIEDQSINSHQFAKHHSASMTDNFIKRLNNSLDLWSVVLVSHFVNIFQNDYFRCILLYNKDKEKVIKIIRRLIGYSYLVLGTRSAAKFEKVPSTSEYIKYKVSDSSYSDSQINCLWVMSIEWVTQQRKRLLHLITNCAKSTLLQLQTDIMDVSQARVTSNLKYDI